MIAIANSAQATQLLHLGDDADKPAALAAIAAAVHHHRHRILALPATEEAATYADEHRYADTSTTAAAAIDNLQSGRWNPPTGSLLIIDDADQLPAEQLHWFTTTPRPPTPNCCSSPTPAHPHRAIRSPTSSPTTCPGPNTSAPSTPTSSAAPQCSAPHTTWPPTHPATTPTATPKPVDCWPAATSSPTATAPPPSAQSGATPTSTATKAETAGSNSDNRRAAVLIGRRSRPSSLSAPERPSDDQAPPAASRPSSYGDDTASEAA